MPPKSLFSSFKAEDSPELSERKAGLDLFLNKIFRHPVLSKQNAFAVFVTSNEESFARYRQADNYTEAEEQLAACLVVD